MGLTVQDSTMYTLSSHAKVSAWLDSVSNSIHQPELSGSYVTCAASDQSECAARKFEPESGLAGLFDKEMLDWTRKNRRYALYVRRLCTTMIMFTEITCGTYSAHDAGVFNIVGCLWSRRHRHVVSQPACGSL
jgi:hypothetical protein